METIIEKIIHIVNDYLHYLNWYYIFIFSIIQYGIDRTFMFTWFTDIKFITKDPYKRIWIVGFITMICFLILVPDLDFNDKNSLKSYLGSMLHGYIIVITFNHIINKYLDKKLNKNEN